MPKDRQHDKEKKEVLNKSSSLNVLDPYLVANGLLRVGGQIKKAYHSHSLKKLEEPCHLTEDWSYHRAQVLRRAHGKTHLSGRSVTLNELRSNGYWIINGYAAVRHFISRCVTCRYLRGTFEEQKMANLQIPVLNQRHSFHIVRWTISVRGILKKAGKKLKGKNFG